MEFTLYVFEAVAEYRGHRAKNNIIFFDIYSGILQSIDENSSLSI